MSALVILAAIPLGLATSCWPEPHAPQPLVAVAAPSAPSHTFDQRWIAFDNALTLRVRTIRILPEPPPKVAAQAPEEEAHIAPLLPQPRPLFRPTPKRIKPAPRDICARHGMHKSFTGRYKWRCKR